MSAFDPSEPPALTKLLVRRKVDLDGFVFKHPPTSETSDGFALASDEALQLPSCSLRVNPLFSPAGDLVCLVNASRQHTLI